MTIIVEICLIIDWLVKCSSLEGNVISSIYKLSNWLKFRFIIIFGYSFMERIWVFDEFEK